MQDVILQVEKGSFFSRCLWYFTILGKPEGTSAAELTFKVSTRFPKESILHELAAVQKLKLEINNAKSSQMIQPEHLSSSGTCQY